jgi:hypothetical protein
VDTRRRDAFAKRRRGCPTRRRGSG